MRTRLALLTLAFLVATMARSQTATDFQSLARLFEYDTKQPLDVEDKIIEEFPDGTLHDITYTSPKGGPVHAYLVVPKGIGPIRGYPVWALGKRDPYRIHSRSQNLR
jgi:hypothetical protein